MSSSAAKLAVIAAVILTIVLATVVYRMSRQYAAGTQATKVEASAQSAVPKTLAVVALKPLSAYKPIGKDDVALVEVSVAPADYFSVVTDVVGKQPLVDVDAGAPVTKRYFGDGNVLARAIPPGFQAISVEINDVIAVGGFVRPGDMVDVLLYLRGAQNVDIAQARVLLRKVRVLAYEELLVERPEGLTEQDKKDGSKAQKENRRSRTAVLAVPETDTTRLMLGASQGELRLAMYGQRPPGSQDGLSPESIVAGGLPANPDALAAVEAGKVPDKAISIDALARIKPPPSKASSAPVKVQVYRSSDVETVSVRP